MCVSDPFLQTGTRRGTFSAPQRAHLNYTICASLQVPYNTKQRVIQMLYCRMVPTAQSWTQIWHAIINIDFDPLLPLHILIFNTQLQVFSDVTVLTAC